MSAPPERCGSSLSECQSPGTLFAVVGPSGVGKDSIIDGLRRCFKDQDSVSFPIRWITRPADAGGEVHHPLDMSEFEEKCARGHFCLHWSAHGLAYGVGQEAFDTVSNGAAVVVNVSRAVLENARVKFTNVVVLSITADETVLRHRLTNRGRTADGDLEARIRRAAQFTVVGDDVVTIANDGVLAEAVLECEKLIKLSFADRST